LTDGPPLGSVAASASRFILIRRAPGDRQLIRPQLITGRELTLPSPPPPPPPSLPPPDLDAFVAALSSGLPEFVPHYLDLVAACDDDPGGPVILMGLADFVAERLVAFEAERAVLDRALGLVEHLIDDSNDPDGAAELVELAFLDSFSPDDRRRLAPWLGARSMLALEALDVTHDRFP
jgi:hypothetical protein